jgi:hypothetical protein
MSCAITADPIIISTLTKKRAEIDGELRQAAKRIAELRADRDAIDVAIRVFDPSRVPHKIKGSVANFHLAAIRYMVGPPLL